MVYRKITDNLALELVSPFNAEVLFDLIEKNRTYLSEYLTWVDETKSSETIIENTKNTLKSFSEKTGIGYVINLKNEIVGRISLWLNNKNANIYEIGYWIIEEKSNQGIMTLCVNEIMKIGIEYFDIEKFEIDCIVENIGSNKIAKKLGYKLEGTKRSAIKVNNRTYDMNQYGILKNEYIEIGKSI